MKLYQAVKQYGVKRVRLISEGYNHPKEHASLKPASVKKIFKAYLDASELEVEILFYNPVSIALYFHFTLPLMKECTEKNDYEKHVEILDQEYLALYILESLEPDNKFVKIRKQWRKRYYSKK